MEITKPEQLRDISSISRALRKSELPEQIIREMPAQSLYLLLKHEGIASYPEILESASIEQLRLVLDFDLWECDELQEERIWDWLEISSEEDELLILQKVANSLDLKLVAYLINKYVNVQQNEEATEAAPGPLYFTPDKGYTWIQVVTEDQRAHFLISRLLAYLFESNSDIFYQLIATKAVITPSLLTDEALKDRSKRLAAEGFPETDLAMEVCAFISVNEALARLNSNKEFKIATDTLFTEPLVKLRDQIEPLHSALSETDNLESSLSEICLIINASFRRFNVSLSDFEKSAFLISQVQGAINIGLETLSSRSNLTALEVAKKAGYQILFRTGLSQILEVSKLARKYRARLVEEKIEIDSATSTMFDFLLASFPYIPTELSKFKDDFEISESQDSLNARPAPFRYYEELQFVKHKLVSA